MEVPRGPKIDPFTIASMRRNTVEYEKMHKGGFVHCLNEMDYKEAGVAHIILRELNFDHANPAGMLCFKTAEERLQAILQLSEILPREFAWRWREVPDKSRLEGMTFDAVSRWLSTQPLKEELLINTSKDPKRSESS